MGASGVATLAAIDPTVFELLYMAAAFLFVIGIKRMSAVRSAMNGSRLAALGMFVAVATTLLFLQGEGGILLVILGVAIGTAAGWLLAVRVPMTSMPEMVGLLNGF